MLMESFHPRVKADRNDNLNLFLSTAAMFCSIYRRYYFERIWTRTHSAADVFTACATKNLAEISSFWDSAFTAFVKFVKLVDICRASKDYIA